MQDMQDMLRRLNQSGKRLSKGHRKIAEYIVEHYDKAVFMTASKLGEKVGVSESTVVRFASAMGYEGYPQLQRALQELVRHWLTAVQRFEMATDIDQSEVLRTVLHADMQNIRTTTEEINTQAFDEVVDKIIAARNIYVMGLRSAAPIAQFLAYYLNFIFDNVRIVSEASGDVFEQISRINESDLLFGISFPRYSTRTIEAMSFAKARGSQVVGLTDGPMSPVYATSTVCLTARTDMASFVDSMAAPLSVINALIVALGLRSAAPIAQFLAYYLNFIFDNVRIVSEASGDVFEQISRINESDLLFGISFPRYSTRTLEAMSFARARGAQVVGLTDGPMSPIYATSTVCLTARTDMASFVDSMAAPLSVINALIVALALRRKDELSEHFRLMEGIWDEYRVYVGKDRV